MGSLMVRSPVGVLTLRSLQHKHAVREVGVGQGNDRNNRAREANPGEPTAGIAGDAAAETPSPASVVRTTDALPSATTDEAAPSPRPSAVTEHPGSIRAPGEMTEDRCTLVANRSNFSNLFVLDDVVMSQDVSMPMSFRKNFQGCMFDHSVRERKTNVHRTLAFDCCSFVVLVRYLHHAYTNEPFVRSSDYMLTRTNRPFEVRINFGKPNGTEHFDCLQVSDQLSLVSRTQYHREPQVRKSGVMNGGVRSLVLGGEW